jgi:hypothetical protein
MILDDLPPFALFRFVSPGYGYPKEQVFQVETRLPPAPVTYYIATAHPHTTQGWQRGRTGVGGVPGHASVSLVVKLTTKLPVIPFTSANPPP